MSAEYQPKILLAEPSHGDFSTWLHYFRTMCKNFFSAVWEKIPKPQAGGVNIFDSHCTLYKVHQTSRGFLLMHLVQCTV